MHPVLFTLPLPWGPQPIYAYGLALGLALIFGFQLVSRLGRKSQLDDDVLGGVSFVATIGGLLGARTLYVLTNLELLSETGQRWFDFTAGGVSAYGGFLGGFAAAALYLRGKRAPLLAYADVAAPAALLGVAVTRVGCYLHGSDFGSRLPDDAPQWLDSLGTFPRWHLDHIALDGSPAYWHHIDQYALPRDATHSFPVHPTQLYELLASIALFGAAIALWRRRRFTGQVFLAATMGYGLMRLLLDSLRDDPEGGGLLGFSSAQLLSLVIVPVAGVAYSLLRKR